MNQNKKGSALQIVLILFLILTLTLTMVLSLLNFQFQSYKNIDVLMKQKNLEILLMKYYVETIDQDILLSDFYETDNYSVKYVVDDMGDYYAIETYVKVEDYSYCFFTEIHRENLDILKFEYRKD